MATRDADAILIEKWAATGDVQTPESQNIPRTTGWTQDFSDPLGRDIPRRVVNQQGREITGMLAEINRHGGILCWDGGVNYQHPALVFGSDMVMYLSVQDSGPAGTVQDPTTDSNNDYWIPFLQAVIDMISSISVAHASTTVRGISELLTNTEAQLGIDTVRTMTAAAFRSAGDARYWREALASETTRGILELINSTEILSSGENTRAITLTRLLQRTATQSRLGLIERSDNSEADGGSNDTTAMTPQKVKRRIDALIDGAPADRNTLKELSDAINGVTADLNVSLPSIANKSGMTGNSVDVELPAASGAYYPFGYMISNLPDGLSISGLRVTGTPITAQNNSVIFSAADNSGNTAQRTFNWNIGGTSLTEILWFVNNSNNTAVALNAITRQPDTTKNIDLGSGTWDGALSDGVTLWFINNATNMAVAYDAITRAADSPKNIDLGSGDWTGGTSDGITLWFLNDEAGNSRLVAYEASSRALDTLRSLNLSNGAWEAVVTDRVTLWILDSSSSDANALAHTVMTLQRDSLKDINFGSNVDLNSAVTDFTTLWFGYRILNRADAYVAATRAADSQKNINLGDGDWRGAVYAMTS